MKAKQFRQTYLCMVHLYGVVFDDDAYKILKEYYTDLKIGEFRKDLKERSKRWTFEYLVIPVAKSTHFVIGYEGIWEKEYNDIFAYGAQHDYHILPYEEFLLYEKKDFIPNPSLYEKLASFVVEHIPEEKRKYFGEDFFVNWFYWAIRFEGFDAIQRIFLQERRFGFHVDGIWDAGRFLNLLVEAHNSTRLPHNRGWSPNELWEKHRRGKTSQA